MFRPAQNITPSEVFLPGLFFMIGFLVFFNTDSLLQRFLTRRTIQENDLSRISNNPPLNRETTFPSESLIT